MRPNFRSTPLLLALAACGGMLRDPVPEERPAPVEVGPPQLLDTQAPERCLSFPLDETMGELTPRFPNRRFDKLVRLVRHPSLPFFYAALQDGAIVRFAADDREGSVNEELLDLSSLLDVRTWEMGLLGLAFRADFASNPEIFLKYTAEVEGEPKLLVVRAPMSADGRRIDFDRRVTLFSLDNEDGYHHGGSPDFGPDGMLYVPIGDGAFDTAHLAQDPKSLRGKIVRVDTRSSPYSVPADNPFVDGDAPEIFALGLRNPFGMSFDDDGSLWVGDVGLDSFEELNHVVAGANYGWPYYEGSFCRDRSKCSAEHRPPAFSYGHDEGLAIVSGPVYRGARFPEIAGQVLLSDYFTGTLLAFDPKSRAITTVAEVPAFVSQLLLDEHGEPLMVEHTEGLIYETLRNEAPSRAPATLSATGCMREDDVTQFAAGVIPYDLNMSLWSDGADKDRAIALPPDATLTVRDDGKLEVPPGSVVIKSFRYGARTIETRFLIHDRERGWRGYSYAWREDGSDADLLPGAARHTWGEIEWQYPSRGQCFTCHSSSASFARGLELRQLDRPMRYPGAQQHASQLTSLVQSGALSWSETPLEAFPARADASDLNAWVRAYLDVNCSGCHRPGGPGATKLDLRYEAAGEGFCDLKPSVRPTGGGSDWRVVSPRRPERSVLLSRMESVDPQWRMPRVASHRVDRAATERVRRWIFGMAECPP